MAYLAFSDLGGAAAARHADAVVPRPDPMPCVHADAPARLSPLEWSVVAIARKDGRGSLRRPGRVTSALRALLRQPNPQLADARLEALRRMAVLTWHHGYTVPSRELRAFLAAGYDPCQYELLVDGIAAQKSAAN